MNGLTLIGKMIVMLFPAVFFTAASWSLTAEAKVCGILSVAPNAQIASNHDGEDDANLSLQEQDSEDGCAWPGIAPYIEFPANAKKAWETIVDEILRFRPAIVREIEVNPTGEIAYHWRNEDVYLRHWYQITSRQAMVTYVPIDREREPEWYAHVNDVFRLMNLYRAIKGIPRSDNTELLAACLCLDSLTKSRFSCARSTARYIIFSYFTKKMLLPHAGELVASCLRTTYLNSDELIDAPAEFAKLQPDFFTKIFKENWNEYEHGDRYIGRLYFNAHFGDQRATDLLIKLFLQNRLDNGQNAYVYSSLLEMLLRLDTPATVAAVLSRFGEETGAPDYVAGCFYDEKLRGRVSPRYAILCQLRERYRHDLFFVKYDHYLQEWRNDTWEPSPKDDEKGCLVQTDIVTDAEIGGEGGVRTLFAEFQAWAKERFNYELRLDGATPRIRATLPPRVLKYDDQD